MESEIPYPLPEPVPADIIERIQAKCETIQKVLQRSNIENIKKPTGEWHFAIRMSYVTENGNICYKTISANQISLTHGLYAIIENIVNEHCEEFHADPLRTILAFDDLYIVQHKPARLMNIRMK